MCVDGISKAADESASIVLMVGEAVTVAANLLGEHVDVLDATVRCAAGLVIREDFIRPPVDGAGEAGHLSAFDLGGVLEEHDQLPAGVGEIDGHGTVGRSCGSDGRVLLVGSGD